MSLPNQWLHMTGHNLVDVDVRQDDLLEAWRETADYDVQYWRRLAKLWGAYKTQVEPGYLARM